MKDMNGIKIIGIDHGYGNMKTANRHFPTGVMSSEVKPTFVDNLLVWNGMFYTIGAGHKAFTQIKGEDEDFFILTLAAIGEELRRADLHEAAVYLAVGLPLTWVAKQRQAFKDYLLRKDVLEFTYRKSDYKVRIIGVDVYPQGFAAVYHDLAVFTGTTMLCDVGNGTMNVMFVKDKRPDPTRCFTEKFGTHQCMLRVKEALMKEYGVEPDEDTINRVFITGTADIAPEYLQTIREIAGDYVTELFDRLKAHGYDSRLVRLYIVGGGGTLIKHFGDYDADRVTINEDICATAKGYEEMLAKKLAQGEAV